MATSPAQLFVRENQFYGRTAIALSAFVFFGFALFDVVAAIADAITIELGHSIFGS